jgi:endonuclease YncB( thermonuclease family)
MPQVVPAPSRNVTPPGVTPAPVEAGPLIREPPPASAPEKARWQRFFLVIAPAAGKLAIGKREISIPGVVAPAPGDTCHAGSAASWQCGVAALAAFRMYLRSRAVDCFLSKTDPGDKVTVPCRIGADDVGLWLLAQGWGMASDKAPDSYKKAADAARCAHLGIWRDEPVVAGCAPAQ